MRVRGSKQRVRLTEVELEPSEQKPMLRIAPAAASLIWLGSITLATAIYMEWLPARALFQSRTPPAIERPVRRVAAESRSPIRARSPEPPPPAPPSVESPPPANQPRTAAAATAEGRTPASENTITTPSAVRESSRTIRGSYYSNDSSWAAGW